MNSINARPSLYFDSNKLSHAYIAAGDIADTLAIAVVCSGDGKRPCMDCIHCSKASRGIHPDITIIDKPEGKREIVVDQIRKLKSDVIVMPNESEKKAYIINNAESMNESAQNAFLRILEEPPSYAVFVLKTDTPSELISTVRSRCVKLKIKIDDTPYDAPTMDFVKRFFSALQHGNTSIVEFMFALETLDKEQFSGFLSAARKHAADELKTACQEKEPELRKSLSHTEQILAKAGEYLDFNVSVGHISGMICASLIAGIYGGQYFDRDNKRSL